MSDQESTRPATAAEAFRHVAQLLQVASFQVQLHQIVLDACKFLEDLAKADDAKRAEATSA